MEAQIQAKSLVVKTFTNAKDINIKGEDETVIRMSWSAFEETTAIFFATVPVEMDADGYIILTYMKSLEQIGQLTKYLSRGKHFLTFTNYIPSKADENVTLIVKGRTEYFESDVRKQEAKILSFMDWIDHQKITTTTTSSVTNAETGEVESTSESVFDYEYKEQPVDTSVPKAFIGAGEIRVSVFAQGLNATAGWDGTLTLEDKVDLISFNSFRIDDNLIESIVTKKHDPERNGIVDTIRPIRFGSFRLQSVTDYFGSSKVIEQQTVQFKLNTYTEKVDGVLKLKTEYQYDSIDQTIDEGQMVSVQVMTTDKQSVEEIEIEVMKV
jgi:hypothetical protein